MCSKATDQLRLIKEGLSDYLCKGLIAYGGDFVPFDILSYRSKTTLNAGVEPPAFSVVTKRYVSRGREAEAAVRHTSSRSEYVL